jgi:hypothetical protein
MEAVGTVTINTEANCGAAGCAELAWKLHRQLSTPHYSHGAAVMEVPSSVEAWRGTHRTARKRADRAARLGYLFAEIDRSQHNDQIHEINVSLPRRQGRPMSAGYQQRHNHGPLPHYPCDRHRVHTYGVLTGSTLVAYLNAYRCGDLLMVSMILGHADHLASDVMYALWQGVVADQAHHGGIAYYNRWDSGEPGLRYFKSKLGFREDDIEWLL